MCRTFNKSIVVKQSLQRLGVNPDEVDLIYKDAFTIRIRDKQGKVMEFKY